MEIALYNWTGEEVCGQHYVPVYGEAEVPPPPEPPRGAGNERPPKRQKSGDDGKVVGRPGAKMSENATKNKEEGTPQPVMETATEPFYRIKTLSQDDGTNLDQRDLLWEALQDVVANLREDPTVPSCSDGGDEAESTQHAF